MTLLRNKGPEYRRSNGELVKQRGEFLATDNEVALFHLRKMMGIRFEKVQSAADATPQGENPVTDSVEKTKRVKKVVWTMRQSPAAYLARHPHGQHADRARACLADAQ